VPVDFTVEPVAALLLLVPVVVAVLAAVVADTDDEEAAVVVAVVAELLVDEPPAIGDAAPEPVLLPQADISTAAVSTAVRRSFFMGGSFACGVSE
jgi:hypothetical protein